MSTELFTAAEPTYPKEVQDLLLDMQAQVDRDYADGTVDDATLGFQMILNNPSMLIAMIEQSVFLEEENNDTSY